MAESSADIEQEAQSDEQSDEAVIGRASVARRVGDDCTDDVDLLLRRAAEGNKAALDRLAK